MATFKDLEDSLRNFMIQEQSDAHNIRTANIAKYHNLKIWMDLSKYQEPHFFVRFSVSEGVFAISGCVKLNGGLGYEERFVYKWFGRIGIKDKLKELWAVAKSESANNSDEQGEESK